jgi:hypothetical protein
MSLSKAWRRFEGDGDAFARPSWGRWRASGGLLEGEGDVGAQAR